VLRYCWSFWAGLGPEASFCQEGPLCTTVREDPLLVNDTFKPDADECTPTSNTEECTEDAAGRLCGCRTEGWCIARWVLLVAYWALPLSLFLTLLTFIDVYCRFWAQKRAS